MSAIFRQKSGAARGIFPQYPVNISSILLTPLNSISERADTSIMTFDISSMLNPEVYDHPVNNIELIETHISWVLLTGSFAYKIKKPVDFGFLDFSTLEKRHNYCEAGLILNRRLAPDIYLEVVPISDK